MPKNPAVEIETCPSCHKLPELCVCASIRPQKTRLKVVILQHPQEPDKDLGSARLAHLALPNSELRIGLSWPNLRAALEGKKPKAAEKAPVPAKGAAKAFAPPPAITLNDRWAVLYLGSGVKREGERPTRLAPGIHFVGKNGAPVAVRPENVGKPLPQLEGIVVLDGTWSQAKTLWWRNAWLLKLRRAVLVPKQASLYKELRREPKRECLSTIETIADTLDALGEKPAASEELRRVFSRLLDKQRERLATRKAKRADPPTQSV